MTTTFLTMSGAVLEFAADLAGLATTPVDASCQIIEATVEGVEKSTTAPATFCQPETDVALPSGSQLTLRFLQDWTDAAGVCRYLFGVDGKKQAFRLTFPPDDLTGDTVYQEGYVTARKPAFGGGASDPLETTITLPAFSVTVGDATTPLEADASA